MSSRDAIAVIEFSLEFDHFFNIDLYVGGFYQLRCHLKTPKKVPSKIDVSIPRTTAPQIFPASVVNGKAVGTAFEILYKEEDIVLNDTIEYKAFVPLKMSKLPNVLQFHLTLELWYIDRDEMTRKATSDVYASFECVSKRHLVLNFPLFRGLHHHRPVMFDYFHLCATTLTVHGSLVALEKTTVAANVAFAKQQVQVAPPPTTLEKHKGSSAGSLEPNSNASNATTTSESSPPSLSALRVQNSSSLASSPDLSRRFIPGSANLTTFEEAVFGALAKTTSSAVQRLQNAYQFHRGVCRLLLTAYEALELKLTQLLRCLPWRYQIRIQSVDCAKKFEILQQNVQRLEDESELLAAIDGNVALLSGELTMLWKQFLELFRGSDEIREQLAKEHHTVRVRRLAEGFFSGSESSSASKLIDFSDVGRLEKMHERMEDQLRKSAYFQSLPPLGVYCEELDGNMEILPVVFEQRYQSSDALGASLEDEDFVVVANNACSSNSAANDAELSRKDALKGALSLDLRRINRPAKQQRRIGTAAVDASGAGSSAHPPVRDGTTSDGRRTKECSWNNLIPYETTLSRKRHAEFRRSRRFNSFPSTKVELEQRDIGAMATLIASQFQVPTHRRLRSAPDLKDHDSFPRDSNQTPATSSDGGIPKNEDAHSTGKIDDSNCRFPVSESLERAITAISLDTERRNSTNESNTSKILSQRNRRTSSLSGEEEEQLTGVSFGLDALALEKERSVIVSPDEMPSSADSVARLTSGIEPELLEFVGAKEQYKQRMRDAGYDGHLCSDFAAFPSSTPYFLRWNNDDCGPENDFHLIVCVHGLDGTCADLRMVRAYIELCLPDKRIDFLMSKRNQMDTFNDFETMTRNLVDELLLYLSHCSTHPTRISFIGHSLGNIIVRSALADPRLEPWLKRLYTFLSLNGPHCGILYNNNSVVNMGIWFVQRWKKSISLQQMALKDHADLRQTFMYQLSLKPCLQYFKYVLLVGSHDDFYVPMHSALIQVCRPAMKDNTPLGHAYTDIVHNIMLPLLSGSRTTVVRYSVFHAQQASSTTSHLLGRAAHIAVLDSDLFIEKLLTVSALRYFR